jgi:5-methyltetrahydrofolate--homocysteine methyltransferase
MVPCLVSVHPNAGLPNQSGAYGETPEIMADYAEEYLREGLVNIIGGCCGTTPAHIAAIAAIAEEYTPRTIPVLPKKLLLAGLEPHELSRERILSYLKKHAKNQNDNKLPKLISEKNYDDAVDIVREMADNGDDFFEVSADNSLPEAVSAVQGFLNYALLFSDIARLPVMISGSSPDIMEAALKCVQGKALINSINLAEGEAEFIRRCRIARSYGAAIIIELIDEEGEAVTEERRLAVKNRAEKLLAGSKAGANSWCPPEDIIHL